MKRLSRHRLQPQLEGLEDRKCPSTTRPIADFLMAQGTTSAFPNGLNPGGPAGLPDELGWATSPATLENNTGRFARVDYTGQDAAFLHNYYGLPDLGTTTSGTISERALPDGTAVDTVNLITHNAFAWANKVNINDLPNSPVVFGYLPSQLAANPTLHPPLADSTLQLVIQIPRPDAPLPDLGAINVTGLPSGYTIVSVSFHATATGTTPTGQQATLLVSQTGLLNRTPIPDFNTLGDFTTEVVNINTHGKQGQRTDFTSR